MRSYFCKKEYHIVGLKRSGNHAIQNWIGGMLPEPIIWLRNNSYLKIRTANRKLIKTPKGIEELLCEATLNKKEWFQKTNVGSSYLIGTEHIEPEVFTRRYKRYKEKVDKFFEKAFSEKTYIVWILRDPFNNLASLLRNQAVEGYCKKFAKQWVASAKEHDGQTNFLMELNAKIIHLDYNEWFRSKGYRYKLAEKMSLEYSEKGLNSITSLGSTFDNFVFQQQAQKMKVLERWKKVVEDLQYHRLLDSDELWSFAEKIYGGPPFERQEYENRS